VENLLGWNIGVARERFFAHARRRAGVYRAARYGSRVQAI
jgi:hypothetical protein